MLLFSKNKKPIMKLFNKSGKPIGILFGKLINEKQNNRMSSTTQKEHHSPLEKY